MRLNLTMMTVAVLASTAFSGCITGYADVTWNSRYVWRALDCVDESVLQPSVWLACRGFTGGVWGSMELTDVNEAPSGDEREMKFTEVDFYLSYARQCGPAFITAGIGDYAYPNTGSNSTAELSLVTAFGVPLTPTLSLYRDIKEADGLYTSIGISQAVPGAWQASGAICVSAPVISASAGYGNSLHNGFYYGYSEAAPCDLTLNASVPVSVGSALYVTPAAHYAMLLDGDIKDLFEDDSQTWGGVSATWYF